MNSGCIQWTVQDVAIMARRDSILPHLWQAARQREQERDEAKERRNRAARALGLKLEK